MTNHPEWYYDEFKQVGTDYESIEEVERYDRRMAAFRDAKREADEALDLLNLGTESKILEIGAGTGEFAAAAAKRCGSVNALDISEIMLEYARAKAEKRGVNNIEFSRAGFLTFDFSEGTFDAVVSQLVLHHLPDFWKNVALIRIAKVLKPGGQLFLRDVVFSFDVRDYERALNNWMTGAIQNADEDMGQSVARHISCEYSTTDALLECMLRSSGFSIVRSEKTGNVLAAYLCKRT